MDNNNTVSADIYNVSVFYIGNSAANHIVKHKSMCCIALGSISIAEIKSFDTMCDFYYYSESKKKSCALARDFSSGNNYCVQWKKQLQWRTFCKLCALLYIR